MNSGIAATASDTVPPAVAQTTSQIYAWYVVLVLAACHLVSFLDRSIITLVIQPIKQDLHLSDTGIGLLTGLGFVILFVVFGLPLGRLADWMNRRFLIISGVAVWSVMTALCGFATSVPTLLAARIGVGVGEASLAPAAFSIMTSYVPPHKLARASSIFTLGASFGRNLGLIGGGAILLWLSQPSGPPIAILAGFKPWQALFFFAALPGVVAIILVLTIREPKRPPLAAGASKRGGFTVMETLRYIHENRRGYYPYLTAACAFVTLTQAMAAWTPTFLVRKYGMSPGESGYILGILVILPAVCSSLCAGWFTDVLRTRGYIDASNRVLTISLLVCLVPGLIFILTNDLHVMEVFLVIYFSISGMAAGPSLAGIQLLTPPNRRGVVNGVFLGLTNLVGFGIGPGFVGALTDYVYRDEALLPYSLATTLVIIVAIGSSFAWFSRRAFIVTAEKAVA